MAMVFLPTAILTIISLLTVFISMLVMSFYPATFVSGSILTLIAATCFVMSEMASFRLYDHVMALYRTDFDKWYKKMQQIIRFSSGNTKISVMLDMAECLCEYEETELAEEVLRKAKKRVMKCGRAYLRYTYLLRVMTTKRLNRDYHGMYQLFSAAYECLTESDFSRKQTRKSCQELFEYERCKMLLCTASPQQLSGEKRYLAVQLQNAAKLHARQYSGNDKDCSSILADCYYIGLTHVLLGNDQAAEKYFLHILSYPFYNPMKLRVQQYMLTKDSDELLKSLP